MVKFIWEDEGRQMHMSKNKKYLLYFRGCSCPPHRGHLKTVTDFLRNKHVGVKVVIDHIASERRHGVPSHLSRAIWATFIRHCLPDVDVIHAHGDFFRHDWISEISDIDRVIVVRGDERMCEHSETERRFKHNWRSKLSSFHELGIEVFYYGGLREEGISATDFVAELKNKRNRSSFLIRRFLPVDVPHRVAVAIVHDLRRCPLR
jgi:hypothetical protein